jgi:hypothetical protein
MRHAHLAHSLTGKTRVPLISVEFAARIAHNTRGFGNFGE